MAEAAAAVGIARSTLYLAIAEGRGPRTVKIGRRRVVTAADLQRWLGLGAAPSPAPLPPPPAHLAA
ncbi:helix-turn-helix transcriptional regulator [Bauldia litoralis]